MVAYRKLCIFSGRYYFLSIYSSAYLRSYILKLINVFIMTKGKKHSSIFFVLLCHHCFMTINSNSFFHQTTVLVILYIHILYFLSQVIVEVSCSIYTTHSTVVAKYVFVAYFLVFIITINSKLYYRIFPCPLIYIQLFYLLLLWAVLVQLSIAQ